MDPKLRRLLGFALTLTALAAIAALTALARGTQVRFTPGPVRISGNSFAQPLACGLVATLVLLVVGWAHRLWRRVGVFLAVVLAFLGAIDFARASPRLTTDADFAVTEIYTELATNGRLVDGPYSRFGWHHPGPLYFYLQALPYALSGHRAAALYAGAVLINLAALMLLAWVVARQHQGPLLPLILAACVVFAWRAPRFLASPWTAHVPVLPAVTFLALCAATASSGPRLLPATLIVGSLVAQTHVGFVPIVGGLSAAVLAIGLRNRAPGHRPFEGALAAAAWVCAALWLVTISEAVSHRGGNLIALLRFFVIDARQEHTFAEALNSWSYGLAGVLRPDFALPWGGHFAPTHPWWTIPCAVGQSLALLVIGRRDLRAGRTFEGLLALGSFLACASGLWALTRVRGDIVDHEIFWLAAFGAVNLAIIGAAGLHAVRESALIRWAHGTRIPVMASALILTAGVALGAGDLQNFTSYELRRSGRTPITAARESIRRYLREQDVRNPLIRIDDSAWSGAAGVLLGLLQDGTSFAVTPEWVPMFTEAFASTGREDAVITIGGRGRAADKGIPTVLLFESGSMYVEAARRDPDRGR